MGYQLLTRIRLTIGCFVLTLALVAGLFIGHHLSAVGFAISVLVLAAAAGVILTRFFQRVRDLPEELDPFHPRDRYALRRQLRRTKIMVAALISCLFLGIWETRRGLIYPTLAGIAINLFFITVFVRSLRRGQAKLKQLEDRRTT